MAESERRITYWTGLAALAAAVGLCGVARAQVPPTEDDTRPANAPRPIVRPAPMRGVTQAQLRAQPLRPVEQSIGDLDPLRTSLRDLRPDLRAPSGFDTVYRLPPATPGAATDFHQGPGTLARVSGALIATFPRSVYTPSEQGTTVEVPPGTIYYIGNANEPLRTLGPSAGAPGPTWAGSGVSTSLEQSAGTAATTSADLGRADVNVDAAAPTVPMAQDRTRVLNVFTDPDYCASRVAQILSSAAARR